MIDDIVNNPDDRDSQERRDEDKKSNVLAEQGKRIIRRKVKNLVGKKAEQLGARAVSFIAQQLITAPIKAAATNPYVLIAVLIIIFIIIIIFFFAGLGDGGPSDETEVQPPPSAGTPQFPPIPGLTVTKTGDTQIEFGQTITYSISVTYTQPSGGAPIDKIVITDKLPSNVEFVSATGRYIQTGGTIEWPLTAGTTSYTFSLVVKPTIDKIEIANTVYGRSLVSSSKLLDSSAANRDAIFNNAASTANVPVALLKAIAKTESEVMSYEADEVIQFNSPFWWSGLADDAPTVLQLPELIQKGYAYNTCAFPKDNPICPGADVRGVTQVELGTWNSIKPRLSFADGRDPDRRYVRDVIYAAAYYLRGKIDTYDSSFNFTGNFSNLNETQVKALARSYCGGSPDANTNVAACGSGRHEQSVWTHYQDYNRN